MKTLCADLKTKLKENNVIVKKQENEVIGMKCEHQIWRKEKEEEKVNLTEIIEAQKREKTDLSKEIVKVIKQKESMVRDTVDKKKCIVMYGLKRGNRACEIQEGKRTKKR